MLQGPEELPTGRRVREGTRHRCKRPPLTLAPSVGDSLVGQLRARSTHKRPASALAPLARGRVGGRRCVTPRQACPRPNGLGRNLHSKTRWFTGFCNSHQVSHFATFFIDARAEISVAESRFCKRCERHAARVRGHEPSSLVFLSVVHARVR
ncbi:hypothetical protein SLA2020_245260 [Shorea laevis]